MKNNINFEVNENNELTSKEIRNLFIDFYKSKWHHEIKWVPLLPENDSTLLFVNSWMFPLVPYLLWESHPMWKKLVNFQRSFRTDDIEEVWDSRHTTMFEMLWNWSLWDYFKEEQLNNWFEFLIEKLKLDPNRIYQSVYWGDWNVDMDSESIEILQNIYKKYWIEWGLWPITKWKWELWPWVDIDFSKHKIFPYVDKNWWQRWDAIWELWWPDSETFYDTWKEHDKKFGEFCHPNCDCWRFIEIWNSVFMQYVKTKNWWEKIDKQNVDFWWGLERLTMIKSGTFNVFKTDLFVPIINELENKTNKKYENNKKKFEIISDHIKASVFLLMDWWIPSNKDQWYFVRRLIRRALLQLHLLDSDFTLLLNVANKLIESYKEIYPDLDFKKDMIISTLTKELQQYSKTLVKWFDFLEKKVAKLNSNMIDWETIFELKATYWIPFELIKEFAIDKWLNIDEENYLLKIKEHQELSRKSLNKKFKSWLADSEEITKKYHTITHLLHKVLKTILWDHVSQKGSNITSERLRFDFSHDFKLSDEEIKKIEDLINSYIKAGFYVQYSEMKLEDAKKAWAIWLFDEKYKEMVKVYEVVSNNWDVISKELCNWPHIDNSTDMWRFKIIKEESIASWIRRIKAILENN